MTNPADPLPDLNYWRQRRQIGLAQSNLLPRAAELSASINWLTISAHLIMGELFGDLTPFTGISLPAIGFAGLAGPPEPRQYKNPTDLYHDLNEVVRRTIRGIPPETPSVLSLSGGRDSRLILFAHLAEKRPLPRLVNARHFIDILNEQDSASAQLLANRLGVPLKIVEQPGDRFILEWDKNRLTGLQSIRHSWGLALAKAVSGPPVLYDGLNGGIILRTTNTVRAILKKTGGKRPSFPVMRELFLEYRLEHAANLIEPWAPKEIFSRTVMQDLRDRLFVCFSFYEHFPDPVQAYLEDQQTRRDPPIFTFGMMPNEAVVCPFDSPDMIRFALSLKWNDSDHPRDLRDETIAHCYPEFADVPYGSQLTNLPSTWQPDARLEDASWSRLRLALAPHLTPAGIAYLDKTRNKLEIIQRATMLAQAYYWDEHGLLPPAAEFFGAPQP